MNACRALLGIALGVAGFGGGRAFAQDPPDVRLRCVSVPTKKQPALRLEGTAPLPDEAVLRVSLYRVEERYVSGRLISTPNFLRSAHATVGRGKFSLNPEVEGPGEYRAIVQFLEEGQRPEHRRLLGDQGSRQWSFDFAAWGDGLAPELGPRLVEVDGLAEAAKAMIRKFVEARGSDESWKKESPALQKQAAELSRKLEEADSRRLYPAAIREIQAAVWALRRDAGASNYHAKGEKLKSRDAQEGAFDPLVKALEEVAAIAGREFALWVLKEIRRAGGTMTRGLSEVVDSQAKRVAVSPFAERLQRATPQEHEELENELRGGRP